MAGLTFPEASEQVLTYLKTAIPLGLWTVTRYDGTDQVYLSIHDAHYGATAGDRGNWNNSFCKSMVAGETPRVAPDAMAIPQYAAAAAAHQMQIGSYMGTPLRQADGSLFGTLCGVDPAARGTDLIQHGALLDLLGSMLGAILDADQERDVQARQLELAEMLAETDALTGLTNRRGWDRQVAQEEKRHRRYGDPTSVLAIDLDGLKTVNDQQGHSAGDRYLRAAAATLREVVRGEEILARIGGDEFVVLAAPISPAETVALVDRLDDAFREHGVAASIGAAVVHFGTGVQGALHTADANMYEDKRRRQARRLEDRRAGERLADQRPAARLASF